MQIGPPCALVPVPMQSFVVRSTKWNGELIADFPSQSARLGKLQVMGINWRSLTNETALSADEGEMKFASLSRGLFGKGKILIFVASAVKIAALHADIFPLKIGVLRLYRIGRRP